MNSVTRIREKSEKIDRICVAEICFLISTDVFNHPDPPGCEPQL